MRRAISRGVLVLATAAAGLIAPALVGGGGAVAHADSCEPTEPVVRIIRPNYEEPIDEQDHPLCYVLNNYVYPRVCDRPDPLLTACLYSLNPNPLAPVVIQPFQPDAGRIICNLSDFVLLLTGQSGACGSATTTQLDTTGSQP